MSDVFISYKRENQDVIEQLVSCLRSEGFSIWWDSEIPGGSRWRQEILEKLEAAKVVVVAWSDLAAGPSGEFVQDEAAVAKMKGTYLPITIDGTEPPLGFRQVQVLPLTGWDGVQQASEFKALVRAIRARLGHSSVPKRVAPSPDQPQTVSARAIADHLDRPSIAVLPFRHPPNDEDQAYFAEGMADDIIAGLSRSRLLRVTSRQSSLSYDAESASTAQACSDLSVRYLVRGQIRRMGDKVRVRIDLIDGDTDEIVWTGHQDRPVDEVFELQDEITQGIVCTIEPALLGREQELAARHPQDVKHWDLFIRGRHHYWRSTYEDFRKADELLLAALEQDPEHAPTLVLLALSKLGNIWGGKTKNFDKTIGEAFDYASRAVAADPRDSASHQALGVVLTLTGQFEQATAEQRRALDLNPSNAPALGELGRLLAFRGDPEEAIVLSSEALRRSPTDPHDWLWLRAMSTAALRAGRPVEALRHAHDALSRRPDFFFLHFQVAVCSQLLGETEAARLACERGVALNENYSLKALRLGYPYANEEDLDTFVNALRASGWQG